MLGMARVGRWLAFAGVIALAVGTYAFAQDPARQAAYLLPGILAATFLPIGVVFWVVGHVLGANERLARELASTGERVEARILDARMTASRIGGNPLIQLELEVPSSLGTYVVTPKVVVPLLRIGAIEAGARIPVLADRSTTGRCAVLVDELGARPR